MANKYGKNGEAVAAFFEEVASTDLDGWRAFLDVESPSPEYTAASAAVTKVPLSASVSSAIYSARLKSIRGLGLSQLDEPMDALGITSRVDRAAYALALGDALAPEHRAVIFAPFVAAGFRSVPEPAPAPTEP